MGEEQDNLHDALKELIVNDYFTPNIKAEVILDALLTPYVAGIVKEQLEDVGNIELIAKEMSLHDPKNPDKSDRGPKVDYVLADEKYVYLVELKTTESSEDGKQRARYEALTRKRFGESLPDRSGRGCLYSQNNAICLFSVMPLNTPSARRRSIFVQFRDTYPVRSIISCPSSDNIQSSSAAILGFVSSGALSPMREAVTA